MFKKTDTEGWRKELILLIESNHGKGKEEDVGYGIYEELGVQGAWPCTTGTGRSPGSPGAFGTDT